MNMNMNRPTSKIGQGNLTATRVHSVFKTQPARDIYDAYGWTWQDILDIGDALNITFTEYSHRRIKDIRKLSRKTHELYKMLQYGGDTNERLDFIFHMTIRDCRIAEKLHEWVVTHMLTKDIKVLNRAVKDMDLRHFFTLLNFDDVLYEMEQLINLSEG